MIERWTGSRNLYEGKIVTLRVGDVCLEDGTTALREVVVHPGGVAVVPLDGDHVILVRQFRIAFEQDIVEIPAGKLEGNESPEERGRCELEEETGYRAGRVVSAGSVFASVGYSSEEIHLFLAFDLEHVGQRLEEDERVELVRVPLGDIPAMLARNEFKDAKTVVGLYALLEYLKK